jgi:A/G-specific adenine glycosylase
MKITKASRAKFQKEIYRFYREQGRDLPWRNTRNPYQILVSEMMLQQTQVDRVLKKYGSFIDLFPDFASLAGAPLPTILAAWSGLGYNRRALALKKCANQVVSCMEGTLPNSLEELLKLPGIGRATASSILTFSFNKPTVFIETNIRMVFIHFFFPDDEIVSDRDITPLVEATLDKENPRDWYYALMDYGSMLKKKLGNLNKQSSHYTKQPPFKGSNRQLRGLLLQKLLSAHSITNKVHSSVDVAYPNNNLHLEQSGWSADYLFDDPEVRRTASSDITRVRRTLQSLEKDGFIRNTKGGYVIQD